MQQQQQERQSINKGLKLDYTASAAAAATSVAALDSDCDIQVDTAAVTLHHSNIHHHSTASLHHQQQQQPHHSAAAAVAATTGTRLSTRAGALSKSNSGSSCSIALDRGGGGGGGGLDSPPPPCVGRYSISSASSSVSGARRTTHRIKMMHPTKMGKKMVGMLLRAPSAASTHKHRSAGVGGWLEAVVSNGGGVGEASIYHALVVIFLEFFAWGLLTSPMINVLNQTFPTNTFLMNGLIFGIKGILSFLAAPLVGALSDIWGRKFFLFVTVFFTCLPIPLMKINAWWYFAMISISGVFAVTFSVVFAYVADVTEEADRSAAYGLVSATFAASLVTSPALGAYIEKMYSEEVVVVVATIISVLDVAFILLAVPESLPDKVRNPLADKGDKGGDKGGEDKVVAKGLTFEQVDPFASLRNIWKDKTILMLCVTVFLSYLPEAGQYSCFFVYLRLVMNFSKEAVAMFIAAIGILSVIAQTGLLTLLMKTLGSKHTIMVGLLFEMLQLMWYGFGSQTWMMWAAGILAAVSSITYPAISAFVSMHADADQQGLVQGMITGMRGLCNGLGPAMFGLIFSLFHVDLNENNIQTNDGGHLPAAAADNVTLVDTSAGEYPPVVNFDFATISSIVPGPPFVFGALLVILALMVAAFIPEAPVMDSMASGAGAGMRHSAVNLSDASLPGGAGGGKGGAGANSGGGGGGAQAGAKARRHFQYTGHQKKKSDEEKSSDDEYDPLMTESGKL